MVALSLNPHLYRIQAYECKNCGWSAAVARKVCPNCFCQEWKTVLLPDKGKVHNFSEVSVGPSSYWRENVQEEMTIGVVELGEKKIVSGGTQIIEYERPELRIGMDVEAVFRRYRTRPVIVYGYKYRPLLRKERTKTKMWE